MVAAPLQTTLSLLPSLTRIVTIVMVVMSHFTLLTTSSHTTRNHITKTDRLQIHNFLSKRLVRFLTVPLLWKANLKTGKEIIFYVFLCPHDSNEDHDRSEMERNTFTPHSSLEIWICSTFIATFLARRRREREAPDPGTQCTYDK